MRKLRENKHNRVYHLISRIAHRAFYLDAGGLKMSMAMKLKSVWRFVVKRVKRANATLLDEPVYAFNVELQDGDKIAFNECEDVIRWAHENFSRTLEISKIDALGYMTYEADPWLYDYFYLINSEGVTYMMPIEWPHVLDVISFLEKTIPDYAFRMTLCNCIYYNTLAVWPLSLAGSKFPLQDTVFPPIFYPWEEDMETQLCQKGLTVVRRH